jgi:hypothetical protein
MNVDLKRYNSTRNDINYIIFVHVNVCQYDIDFYVKSIDTYVQFDGVYWHGLDREKRIIEQSLKPRDKVIFSTIVRDLKQNKDFVNMGLKLIRITDKEFSVALKNVSSIIQILRKIKDN